MPPIRCQLSPPVLLVLAGMSLSACADTPGQLESQRLESRLPSEMSAKLKGLRVRDVECIFLSPARTRCFARGDGPAGPFEVPVFVGERRGRPVWEVAEHDVTAARTGERTKALALKQPVTVGGKPGERVRVNVTALSDPLLRGASETRADPATRRVEIRLDFRNEGTAQYVDTPQSRIALGLADGALLAPAFVGEGPCRTDDLLQVHLEPGERASGCVAFDVPVTTSPERMSLGIGSSRRVFEWRLNSELV